MLLRDEHLVEVPHAFLHLVAFLSACVRKMKISVQATRARLTLLRWCKLVFLATLRLSNHGNYGAPGGLCDGIHLTPAGTVVSTEISEMEQCRRHLGFRHEGIGTSSSSSLFIRDLKDYVAEIHELRAELWRRANTITGSLMIEAPKG